MLKLKIIDVKHAFSCLASSIEICENQLPRVGVEFFRQLAVMRVAQYALNQTCKTSLFILPEPGWHGFLENLV